MRIDLSSQLQNVLPNLTSLPQMVSPEGSTGAELAPEAPAPAPSEPTPLPTLEPPGAGEQAGAPAADMVNARFRIASLMPFLKGKPLFRGPLAEELGPLAEQARTALEQLPGGEGDKQTLRELRDAMNGALEDVYAAHEPGEPISKQEMIDAVKTAFESFLAALSGGEDEDASEAEAEAGAESGVESMRSMPAPRPTRESAPVDPVDPVVETPPVEEAAAPVDPESDVVSQLAAESEPFSADRVRQSLQQWIGQLEADFTERMNLRHQAWDQWIDRVRGFYVNNTDNIASEIGTEGGFDTEA